MLGNIFSSLTFSFTSRYSQGSYFNVYWCPEKSEHSRLETAILGKPVWLGTLLISIVLYTEIKVFLMISVDHCI